MKHATIISLISFRRDLQWRFTISDNSLPHAANVFSNTASREALGGTWRQSLTLKTSELWSQNQQMQLADDNPFTKQTVYGQTRTSVMSLAKDTYWQQQRDKRKSSLLQKIPLDTSGLPQTGLSQSTGAAEESARHPSFGQRADDRQVRLSAQSLYSTMHSVHLHGMTCSILPALCMQAHR